MIPFNPFLIKKDENLIAVIDGNQQWTYDEIAQCTFAGIHFLNKNKIKKVLVDLPQGFYGYAAICAAYSAGVTFCPVSNTYPEDRKKYMVNAFNPDLVICTTSTQSIFKGYKTILPDEFFKEGKTGINCMVSDPPGNAIAYVIFTSGSTGLPKAVKVARAAFQNFLRWSTKEYCLQKGDRWAQYSSLGFDLSLCDIFTVLISRATLVTIGTFQEKLLPGNIIKKNKITIWHSVPTVISLLSEREHITPEILGGLKTMIFCGEPLYPHQLDAIFKVNPNLVIYNTYGPTESTIICTYLRLTINNYKAYCYKTVCIGTELPSFNVKLQNVKRGIGEIIIVGNNISEGYLDQKDNTQFNIRVKKGTAFKTYATGDYGYYKNGNLYFAYRRDTQIKINGNRVDLSEVDFCIREFGYQDCKTVYKDKRIISFVKSHVMDETKLRSFLERKLPRYYLPHFILRRSEFPYSDNLKLNTVALIKSINLDLN